MTLSAVPNWPNRQPINYVHIAQNFSSFHHRFCLFSMQHLQISLRYLNTFDASCSVIRILRLIHEARLDPVPSHHTSFTQTTGLIYMYCSEYPCLMLSRLPVNFKSSIEKTIHGPGEATNQRSEGVGNIVYGIKTKLRPRLTPCPHYVP